MTRERSRILRQGLADLHALRRRMAGHWSRRRGETVADAADAMLPNTIGGLRRYSHLRRRFDAMAWVCGDTALTAIDRAIEEHRAELRGGGR